MEYNIDKYTKLACELAKIATAEHTEIKILGCVPPLIDTHLNRYFP